MTLDSRSAWSAAIDIIRWTGRPAAERIAEDPATHASVARALRLILSDEQRYRNVRQGEPHPAERLRSRAFNRNAPRKR